MILQSTYRYSNQNTSDSPIVVPSPLYSFQVDMAKDILNKSGGKKEKKKDKKKKEKR